MEMEGVDRARYRSLGSEGIRNGEDQDQIRKEPKLYERETCRDGRSSNQLSHCRV